MKLLKPYSLFAKFMLGYCSLYLSSSVIAQNINQPAENKTHRFSGIIQATRTHCAADGICSITISGITVITDQGWLKVGTPIGKVIYQAQVTFQDSVGLNAEVYCGNYKAKEKSCSLIGNKDYFVKIYKK